MSGSEYEDEDFDEQLLQELEAISENINDGEESDSDEEDRPVFWTTNPQHIPNTVPCSEDKTQLQFGNLNEFSTPLEVLQVILTKEIVENIIYFSNKYAENEHARNDNTFKNFKNVTFDEFWLFIGVHLHMGIIRKPSYKDYWCGDEFLSTPIFSATIGRDRFENILRAFHFIDNNETEIGSNRMLKLGNFLPDVLARFKELIVPGENLCIDESLLPFHGRLSFKQYIPMKRARFGIKSFILVDAETNFIISILPYYGKKTELSANFPVEQYGYGGAVVLTLAEDYLNKHRKITFDNWFMSPMLAHELLSKGTYCLGTARRVRKGMPKFSKKLAVGECEVYVKSGLMVERWRDKREVVMLSTAHSHQMVPTYSRNSKNAKLKPQSVCDYNHLMGGVDNVDRITKPYSAERKTLKWFKKLAFHIIDMCIFNSWVMYKKLLGDEKIDYKTYLMTLIKQIYSKHKIERHGGSKGQIMSDEGRLTGMHLPMKMTKKDGRTSFSPCFFCRIKGIRRETSFKCDQCKRRFCIDQEENCFYLYHSLKKLPKKTASKSNVAPSTSAFLLFCEENKMLAISKVGAHSKTPAAVSKCLQEMWMKSSNHIKKKFQKRIKTTSYEQDVSSDGSEDMEID